MENAKKHIAAIFEEQKVFITFKGDCYRYETDEGSVRCFKMNKLAQKMFWENYRTAQIMPREQLISWRPVAFNDLSNGQLPDKEKEMSLLRKKMLSRRSSRISIVL